MPNDLKRIADSVESIDNRIKQLLEVPAVEIPDGAPGKVAWERIEAAIGVIKDAQSCDTNWLVTEIYNILTGGTEL